VSTHEPIIEADKTDSRLDRVKKLLEQAEHAANLSDEGRTPEQIAASKAEAEAMNIRAAELIAKYGIDRAMLAASGQEADAVIDRVFWITRPFAEQMRSMLWNIAYHLRASGTYIKQWDETAGPKHRGGQPKGGWKFGLRIFAHKSDMERIEMLYASARLQALAGTKKIVNREEKFGQAQKADRVSYLEGFTDAVATRIRRSEKEAEARQKAKDEELRDLAMLEGKQSGPGVALVLADRRKAVSIAMDLANGITCWRTAHGGPGRTRRPQTGGRRSGKLTAWP